MDKIKTGILGYGSAAKMHMTSLAMCPERTVTGVYGPNLEKAKAFAAQYTEFSNHLLYDAPLSYTFTDAAQTVRLINAIFRSQKEDRKIYL